MIKLNNWAAQAVITQRSELTIVPHDMLANLPEASEEEVGA